MEGPHKPERQWRKAAGCANSACVEVAIDEDQYLVRDSKDPWGPILTFTAVEWEAFVAGVRAGDFESS